MKRMKEDKGITLIILAVSILILAIIVSVTIYNGTVGIDDAENGKLHSEVRMVQHAVLEQYIKFKNTKDRSYLVGDKIELSQVQQIAQEIGINLVNIPNTYANKDYYILTEEHLEQIGITNTNTQYIVNYVSGEVINFTQKTDNSGKPIYVQGDNFNLQQ